MLYSAKEDVKQKNKKEIVKEMRLRNWMKTRICKGLAVL